MRATQGETEHAGHRPVTPPSTHAVDRDRPGHCCNRHELHGSLNLGDRQSEDPRGVRHQRDRHRRVGVGLGAHLRNRPVAIRLSARSGRSETAGRAVDDRVVAVPGGGRYCRQLFPVDAVAHRPRRNRGTMLPISHALGQRLVRRQGPRYTQRRVYVGRLHRPDARTADPDRPDARLQLARDVHRHGPGRDRRLPSSGS